MEEFLVLPKNYQEQLINCELEFQNELNETNIRKLLYLYTLGMQHYNITGKKDFEKYYKTKLNNLLLNESVINYLDTHKVDLTKKVDLNLFKKKKRKIQIFQDGPILQVQKLKIEIIIIIVTKNLLMTWK